MKDNFRIKQLMILPLEKFYSPEFVVKKHSPVKVFAGQGEVDNVQKAEILIFEDNFNNFVWQKGD